MSYECWCCAEDADESHAYTDEYGDTVYQCDECYSLECLTGELIPLPTYPNPTSESKGGKLSLNNLNRNHQTLLVIDGKNGSGRASRVVDSVNRSGGDYDSNGTIKADVIYVNGDGEESASAKEIRAAAADAGYNGVLIYRAV